MRFIYDAEVETIVPKDGGYEIRWLPVGPDQEEDEAASDLWHPIQVDGVVICAGTGSRRFASILGDRLKIAEQALRQIALLYAVEGTVRGAAPEIRLASVGNMRRRSSPP